MVKNWKMLKDRVELNYEQGNLYVSIEDFNRAFGAIINATYDAVKRDFALNS